MALVSKNFSDIITFSRASTATRVNASGRVETVAANTPRFDYDPITLAARGILIEEQRTNVSTYSEHLAAWSAANALVVPNATTAPDGSFDAVKLVENTAASVQHFAYQNYSLAAGTYAQSVYVKAGERTRFMFSRRDIGGFSAFFNLTTGTVISSTGFTSVTITAINNGWYRVSAVLTLASSATVGFGLEVLDAAGSAFYTGDGTSGLFLWGAQFESGAFPTSYIPSTVTFTGRSSTGTFIGANGLIQTASAGVARYQYNPADLTVPPFLLLEAAATNLLTYSEQFDNAAWLQTNVTVTANSETAPDGTVSADSLVENTATGAHSVYRSAGTLTGAHTTTFYVKPAGRSWCYMEPLGTSATRTYFNLSGSGSVGTTGSGVTASIAAVGNGWYRITTVYTYAAQTGWVVIGAATADATVSYLGNGAAALYLWGAQLEAGSFATSYIPTTTASVTRAADTSTSAQTTRSADVASVNTLSPWFNATEGTFYAEFAGFNSVSGIYGRAIGYDGPRSFIGGDGAVNRLGSWNNSANLSVAFTGNVLTGAKAAMAYSGAGRAIVGNAGTVATDSNLVGTVTTVRLGNSVSSNEYINGHIRSIKYFPRRLSNAELQTLTA